MSRCVAISPHCTNLCRLLLSSTQWTTSPYTKRGQCPAPRYRSRSTLARLSTLTALPMLLTMACHASNSQTLSASLPRQGSPARTPGTGRRSDGSRATPGREDQFEAEDAAAKAVFEQLKANREAAAAAAAMPPPPSRAAREAQPNTEADDAPMEDADRPLHDHQQQHRQHAPRQQARTEENTTPMQRGEIWMAYDDCRRSTAPRARGRLCRPSVRGSLGAHRLRSAATLLRRRPAHAMCSTCRTWPSSLTSGATRCMPPSLLSPCTPKRAAGVRDRAAVGDRGVWRAARGMMRVR